jgi:hypothetical protein
VTYINSFDVFIGKSKLMASSKSFSSQVSLVATGILLATLGAGSAEAITFTYGPSFGSTNDPTGATAEVDLDFADLVFGQVELTFTIKNTTVGPVDSKLMGIGFDLADGDLADLFGITNDSGYNGNSFFNTLVFDDSSIKGQAKDLDGNTTLNFNATTFDIGIANKSTLMGSGSPNSALAEGGTTTVTLTLPGTSTSGTGYNAAILESALTTAVNDGKFNTAARFKAISGGGGADSDKLVGGCIRTGVDNICGGGDDPNPTIPEPTAGLGLVAFGAVATRLKRNRQDA